MTHGEIREKFLKFFEDRGHKIVPSSSLLPADPSVLFTTAGMQQFKPYFLGDADPVKDFGGRRTVSIQKSMRTSDIDEVGDESHLTFFEMLGHFSFGDYFKKETIEWTYEFLTDVLKISKDRLSATVFAGDDKIPFDEESYNAWSRFLPADRIRKGPREDNVWGPPGPEGPCGAANEVYVDDMEVATLVFMEYNCDKDQNLTPLPQKGVDVGWGLERIVMITQGKGNIFETDLFEPIMKLLLDSPNKWLGRIIADHARAVVFLIADGVTPSNKERGYVLRRLLRRMIIQLSSYTDDFLAPISKVVDLYGSYYTFDKQMIIDVVELEADKFQKTLTQGRKELERLESIDATKAFMLYESYGLPFEVIKDLGREKAKGLTREAFDEEFKKHQEKSRAGAEKKFGGHGLLMDTGELKAGNEEELKKATRLHTATHLLHAALRKVLDPPAGGEVQQAGSDITAERLRFDFTFPRKMTPEEIKQVEDMVNEAVQKDYKVTKEEMSYEDAVKSGAMAFFKLKYPNRVNVYTIGPESFDPELKTEGPVEGHNPSSSNFSGPPFSRELCGGPHVSHTGEIGHITITKEEAVSAGVRRIRAVVE
ncbi:MAG: hypothetical protein A3I26_01505 [Candidatus Yanofskybacteria bacterium RIFCSPLOWO2_02_FULL_43_10]|uniref:alanine--tRNA ligase n=1 Tax=Candidatus Yanofskybacteria bacterium RIFCSPLOWO2_12_FULL_43_11b TaxID=1802710 RepID=A0A1F8H7A0_9BACT|nr:MAG: hypothetical protein A2742_01095 [Candidatus Yanofskybacteria bacterium RIFCSPHIGHO2_01_FULL_43_32]OGN11938.1 MAG: hypothetical protein A3C69_02635 [Candidatus Yanofskybacteria bacterium RIFCSPHIGHO2_02_FULL_43_12]OGN24349.1 MAG: hypothetical protein A2923_00335 [Candidatus Yanofskybacteria bacterium RIFCSPLOWO2_01_FULL_43_46]OGN29443.1 MAG: hypothetical protein A3I26_01505 [Candidatus Yanofskybacteria bacterium RIFCSPLOWO2_02_FULL_43_10]OGN33473.1 MAG: hypothetical protein A3G51_01765 